MKEEEEEEVGERKGGGEARLELVYRIGEWENEVIKE